MSIIISLFIFGLVINRLITNGFLYIYKNVCMSATGVSGWIVKLIAMWMVLCVWVAASNIWGSRYVFKTYDLSGIMGLIIAIRFGLVP